MKWLPGQCHYAIMCLLSVAEGSHQHGCSLILEFQPCWSQRHSSAVIAVDERKQSDNQCQIVWWCSRRRGGGCLSDPGILTSLPAGLGWHSPEGCCWHSFGFRCHLLWSPEREASWQSSRLWTVRGFDPGAVALYIHSCRGTLPWILPFHGSGRQELQWCRPDPEVC